MSFLFSFFTLLFHLWFSPCLSLSFFLWCPIILCCSALLSWCHSGGKCHRESEKCFVTLFLNSFFKALTAFSLISIAAALSLHSHGFDSKVLWALVRCINGEAVFFPSYFAFSHLESVTFSLNPGYLYYWPPPQSHLCPPFFKACWNFLCLSPFLKVSLQLSINFPPSSLHCSFFRFLMACKENTYSLCVKTHVCMICDRSAIVLKKTEYPCALYWHLYVCEGMSGLCASGSVCKWGQVCKWMP